MPRRSRDASAAAAAAAAVGLLTAAATAAPLFSGPLDVEGARTADNASIFTRGPFGLGAQDGGLLTQTFPYQEEITASAEFVAVIFTLDEPFFADAEYDILPTPAPEVRTGAAPGDPARSGVTTSFIDSGGRNVAVRFDFDPASNFGPAETLSFRFSYDGVDNEPALFDVTLIPIPSPGALALAGPAGLALLRRRR